MKIFLFYLFIYFILFIFFLFYFIFFLFFFFFFEGNKNCRVGTKIGSVGLVETQVYFIGLKTIYKKFIFRLYRN